MPGLPVWATGVWGAAVFAEGVWASEAPPVGGGDLLTTMTIHTRQWAD